MNVNKVIIVGRITKDPELKSLPSGTQVCGFSIATNEVFLKDGVKQEKTEFHNIVSFGKTADNIARYMKKGNEIYIEGKIQTRSWDGQDGKKQYRTEIVAQNVQFGARPTQNGVGSSSAPVGQKSPVKAESDTMGGIDYPIDEVDPNDIPF